MKKLLLTVSVLLLSITLIACGKGGNDGLEGNGEIYVEKDWDIYKEGHNVVSPVEIDFWSANSAVDVHGTTLADLVNRFNQYQKETYPSSAIRVNLAFQGGYINQNSKLQASLISNTNPELAMVGVSSMALYHENVIDQRRIFTYDQIRDIYEGFLQFAMYKHTFVGYPYFAATNLLLVNRTLVDQTGIDVPTVDEILADPENSTWNWEMMREVALKLRKTEDDKEYYGLAANSIALYEMMFTQGVNVYNDTATKQLFNNEYGEKGLTYWQNLVKDEAMKNPVLDPNHGTRIQGEFSSGQVGLMFSSSSIIKTVFDIVASTAKEGGETPLFEMDVLPHPKDKNFYSNQSGGGIILFNNKSNARTMAAVEFLRWLQAPEQSAYYSTQTGYLATTRESTQTQIWLDYKAINPLLDRAINLMVFTVPEGLKLPIGRAKALADDDFMKYSKGIFYNDANVDVKAVLKETADRVQYILDANS
jgi:sn-glycerol 3-phosphate transport system substrate-binding protein